MENLKIILRDKGNYSVIKSLAKIGCCEYCVFRFFNVQDFSIFLLPRKTLWYVYYPIIADDSENEALGITSFDLNFGNNSKLYDKIYNKLSPSILSVTSRCPFCLGILSLVASPEFSESLFLSIETANYDFVDSSLSFKLPTCLLIREFSICSYILDKTDRWLNLDEISYSLTQIKDVLRSIIGNNIKKHFNREYNISSPFQIDITFEYSISEDELKFLNLNQYRFASRVQKRQRTKESVARVSSNAVKNTIYNMSSEKFILLGGLIPPAAVNSCIDFSVKFMHQPILLAEKSVKLHGLLVVIEKLILLLENCVFTD